MRITWGRIKVEVFVECFCLIVLGMNGKGADASNLRGLKSAQHGVFQKSGSKSLALPSCSNRKTSKQHNGNRMTGKPFGQSLGSIVVLNLPDHESVVASNLAVRKSYVGLRSTGLLVLKSKTNQEPIEWLTSTVECFNHVPAVKLFNPDRTHLDPAPFEHAGLVEKLGKAWRRFRWSIQRSLKGLPLFSVEAESLTIGQCLSSTCQGAFKYKIAHRSAFCLGSGMQNTLGRFGETKVELFCTRFWACFNHLHYCPPLKSTCIR